MLNYKEKREKGFTLVELLIAMALALVIITALSSAFISQRKTYAVQEQVSEMVQNARAAMDMITREVKMAGYDPTGTLQKTDSTASDFVGVHYDTTQLQFAADLNGDEEAGDDTEEVVQETTDADESEAEGAEEDGDPAKEEAKQEDSTDTEIEKLEN